MKKALEEAADKNKLAVVEVIRRSITATLEEEKSAVRTAPSKADDELRQKLLEVAGSYLAGPLLPDSEYQDADEWEEPLSESSREYLLDECRRLGLEDVITVLKQPTDRMGREEDIGEARWLDRQSKDLSLLLFRIVNEPHRLAFQRAEQAKQRLIATFENSSASAARETP